MSPTCLLLRGPCKPRLWLLQGFSALGGLCPSLLYRGPEGHAENRWQQL